MSWPGEVQLRLSMPNAQQSPFEALLYVYKIAFLIHDVIVFAVRELVLLMGIKGSGSGV